MYHLVDAWTLQLNFPIVCIADSSEGKSVVATALGLNGQVCSRCSEMLRLVDRRFLITLLSVVDLEWRCPMKNEGSRDTSISGAIGKEKNVRGYRS